MTKTRAPLTIMRPALSLACAALFLAMLGSACGSAQPRRNKAAAQEPFQAGWQRVPSDTPYLYAALAPIIDQSWWRNELRGYALLGKRVLELEHQGVDASDQLSATQRRMLGALREIDSNYNINAAALERIGIGASSRLLLYGAGMWPVVRLEVSRPGVLRPHLQRILEQLGVTDAEQKWQEQDYWRVPIGDWLLLMTLRKRELVLALSNEQEDATMLPILFRDTVESPLARSELLKELQQRVGVGDFVVYGDIARFVQLAVAKDGATKSAGDNADACRQEATALAALAPRFWVSGESLPTHAHAAFFVDLRPDLAEALMKLLTPLVDDKQRDNAGSVARASIAMDVRRMITGSLRVLTRLEEEPFACPALVSIAAPLATVRTNLQSLSYSPLARFTSLSAVIDELDFQDGDMRSLRGMVVARHAQPEQLFSLMRMIPDATLPDTLEPGDPPARIAIESLKALGPVDVALGTEAIGMAVGMSKELSRAVTEQPVSSATLMRLWLGKAFWRLVNEVNEDEQEDDGFASPVVDPYLREAMQRIDEGLGGQDIEDATVELKASENGLASEFEIRFAAPAAEIKGSLDGA